MRNLGRHCLMAMVGLAVVAGFGADGTTVAASEADNQGELSPAALADGIEAAMRRFESVEYVVEYSERRNNAPFSKRDPPVWLEGEGRYIFRGDGRRWLLDERGYTFTAGEASVVPERRVSGFDGETHFHFSSLRSVLILHEDDFGLLRARPRAVFWHGGLSADNLLAILRKPEAKVVRQVEIDKHPCLVVEAQWVDDWDKARSPRRFEATISPEQSYLPLKTVWERRGAVEAQVELRGIKEAAPGIWYPLLIRIDRPDRPFWPVQRTERIKSFQVRDAEHGGAIQDSEFQFSAPFGVDIVDRSTGTAWHNDPWWPDLAPWIKANFDWPRPEIRLDQIQSYADPAIDGQPAPAIDAAEWLNGDPGDWKRKERLISVLYFFPGGIADPHTRWAPALKAWHEKYREEGVELIGIVSGREAEAAKANVEELNLTFRIAIDKPSERSGGAGKTFDAFKIPSEYGFVVVDHEAKIRLLGGAEVEDKQAAHPLDKLVRKSLETAGKEPKPLADSGNPPADGGNLLPELKNPEVQQIVAEWKRLAASKAGSARIRGRITLGPGPDGAPPAQDSPARVHALPQLWMLIWPRPGAYTNMPDRDRSVEVAASEDGGYVLDNLRKGAYSLTFSRAGFATAERKVIVDADDSEVALDLTLDRGDAIAGRVVDSDDQPVLGASIRATQRHLKPYRTNYWTTAHLPNDAIGVGDRGQFTFEGLYEGLYTFEVTAEGYQKATIERIGSGATDLKIVLKK